MKETKSASDSKTAKSYQLYHISDSRLSILTTTADLARILLTEATGIAGVSMHAAYNLANMQLSLREKPSETDLSDLVEFIIVMGNSSSLVTPQNVDSYLAMKNDIRSKESKRYSENDPIQLRPNKKFHDLLANAIVGEPIEKEGTFSPNQMEDRRYQLLQDIVNEVSSFYRTVISGAGKSQNGNEANENRRNEDANGIGTNPNERITDTPKAEENSTNSTAQKIPLKYIPNEYISAARTLLVNFPILTRLEITNYDDVKAGIKLDTMLPRLPEYYVSQLRDMMESRVREIATIVKEHGKAQGISLDEVVEDEKAHADLFANLPKRLPAGDILYHARSAFLATYGIEAATPRIAIKHVKEKDYETAVLSAISKLSRNSYEIQDDRKRRREMDSWVYYRVPGAFTDKSLYLAEMKVGDDYDDDGHVFTSNSERDTYCRRIVRAVEGRLHEPERDLLEFLLKSAGGKKKYDIEHMADIVDTFWPSISRVDPIAWLLLARISGLTPFYNTAEKETENTDDNETASKLSKSEKKDTKDTETKKPRPIYALGITALALSDPLEQSLTRQNYWRGQGTAPKDADIWTFGNTTFTRTKNQSDFERFTNAMIATFVHNRQLLKTVERVNELGYMEWNSPMLFAETYSPQDKALASILMERYPIFSRLMVTSHRDISNGIILSTLQTLTDDFHVDTTATISQNLFVRQLHAMNSLAEVYSRGRR